jgi:hypothetical protein
MLARVKKRVKAGIWSIIGSDSIRTMPLADHEQKISTGIRQN